MKKITLILILFCTFSFSQNMVPGNGSNLSLEVPKIKDIIKWENSVLRVENLLQKYILISSESGNEKNAGEFIKGVCKENGLHISEFGKENGNYNFAASIFPLSSKKPNIIFLNHIDCVPENTDSLSVANNGKIINGEIYGRGAIDNKGAAAMQLLSILNFKNTTDLSKKYNATFLAVSCEESQCDGGINFVIANYFDILNPVVVIGEGPSELSNLLEGEFKHPVFGVSVAHKRAFWLRLDLEINTIGHGSITPLSYANKEMVRALNNLMNKKTKAIYNDLNISMLNNLAEHKKGLQRMVMKNPKFFKPILVPQLRKQPELFSLFSNTVTLTNLDNNTHTYNKIPSNIEAYLDCRLLPMTDENKFLNQIKKILNNDAIKISIIQKMPRTKPSDIENIFFKNYEKAIRNKYSDASVLPILLPNVNDLGAFRAKGIPCFASIPVYLTRDEVESVHNKNEHINIRSLQDGAEIYYGFLELMEN